MRCSYCHRSYHPDPRTAKFQKACGRPACRRARQAANYRCWMALHPTYGESRRSKVRAWAAAVQYWPRYRQAHPEYTERDNRRRRRAYRRSALSAKQITTAAVTRRKLQDLTAMKEPASSAKQIAIDRRVDHVVDFLVWKEHSAKQSSIASHRRSQE